MTIGAYRWCGAFSALSLLIFGAQVLAAPIDPEKGVASPDGKTIWYDGKLIGVEGKGWADTKSFYDRLPAKAEGKVPSSVWGLSHQSAGLCVRFTTDAPQVQVRWTLLPKGNLSMPHMPATGVSGVDLYARDEAGRWAFVGNGRPSGPTNIASFTVRTRAECLLYLPLYNGVTSVEIGVAKGKVLSTVAPTAGAAPKKPVVFYGTSITQGGCASRPGLAFPAIVGRKLDVPVVNLGFSGSGRMEPALSELLAELDPSVYVLDCLWNMSPEQVRERVEPFVKALRAVRPDTPIVLAEDCSVKNVSPTTKGQIVREVHKRLVEQGVTGVRFLANSGMLGEDGEGTVDGVHPNDLGMMRQAEVFAKALAPVVVGARK